MVLVVIGVNLSTILEEMEDEFAPSSPRDISRDWLMNRSIDESVQMVRKCDIYHIKSWWIIECSILYLNHTWGLDWLVSDKSRRLFPVDCDGWELGREWKYSER